MTDRMVGIDDQLRDLVSRPSGNPVVVPEMKGLSKPVRMRMQYAIVCGAYAVAAGTKTTVAYDPELLRCTISDGIGSSFTVQQVDSDRAVLSGRVCMPSEVPEHELGTAVDSGRGSAESLFAGIPTWVAPAHLDPNVENNSLGFCNWFEDDQWWRPASGDVEPILTLCGALIDSTTAAVTMAKTVRFTDTDVLEAHAKRLFPLVQASRGDSLQPVSVDRYLDGLSLLGETGTDYGRAIDYQSGWDILAGAGIAEASGLQSWIDELVVKVQALAGSGVSVGSAGHETVVQWLGAAPVPEIADEVLGTLRRIRDLMFRAGAGVWWWARITPERVEFGDPENRPPAELTLSPLAYRDDLARFVRPVPGWLREVWHGQAARLRSASRVGGVPVAGVPTFAELAGRWAAVAGVSMALASEAERAGNALPIYSARDGMWCRGAGYGLRLTALGAGRGVLSGYVMSAVVPGADIVDGVPEWVGLADLHPAVNHGALSVCWWWDGAGWSAVPGAPNSAGAVPIPWALDHRSSLLTLSEIARVGGLSASPNALDDFLTTSERDPAAAHQLLRALVNGV